jgi:phenylalanyl-tRNA synthetase beta chain
VLGAAREVAAGLNFDLRMPEISYADAAENKLSIKVENKDLCNSYKAVVIDGIKPIETPIWMKARLIKAEIRPISLVVDITNYVMIETGHPMHAFDYEKLKDHKIVVRKAKEEEKILALDGKEYELDFENLIIADAQNPIAIAGVMGGEESSVTESTKTIVFESAVFDPTTDRKTSKKLGLSSDSSYRFERGVSQEISDLAINRAVFLLKQICPSIKILQKVEVKTEASETKIELRASRVSQVIGKKYQKTRIHELLERLNFQMIKKTDDILEVTIPSYRNDITQEIDLIEEIVRLDGVDNIASEPMFISPFFDKAQNDKWNRIHDVKRFFKSLNFHEAINYSFLSAEKIGEDVANCFRIINPLSKEEEYLNISRLPRLIENAVTSFRRNEESIKLFEFGKSYFKNTNDPEKLENNEKYKLAAVVIGNQEELSWQQATKKMDFFYLKGVLETFCGDFLFVENDVFSGGKKIGFIKQLDYEKTDIFVFEIEIDLDAITPAKKYEKLSSFPFVSRDLSLITNKTVKYEDIQKVILEAGGELLKNIKVFDVYEGAPIEQDFRNISVRLYFQSEKKTLEDKTVNFIQDKILDELNEKLCVKLRP